MAEQASRHEKEPTGKIETLKTEVRRLRQGCQHGAVLLQELDTTVKAELAKLQKRMEEEIEAQCEVQMRNLLKELSAYGGERQGCQLDATLLSELTENEHLKAELGELQRQMKKEIEACEAQLQSFQEELNAYGGEG